MENVVAYWCKTMIDRNGSLKVVEIYEGADGLFRVYTEKTKVALVFGSWEAIYEKFPLMGTKIKEVKRLYV